MWPDIIIFSRSAGLFLWERCAKGRGVVNRVLKSDILSHSSGVFRRIFAPSDTKLAYVYAQNASDFYTKK